MAIFTNNDPTYDITFTGFDKNLIKGGVSADTTPELVNIFTSGLAPKNILAGELLEFVDTGQAGISGIGSLGSDIRFWAGDTFENRASAPFRVDQDGNVTMTSATLSGSIDIGGADSTSFHVDINGNMWLGAATFATAPFTISNVGALTAISGTIGGWTIGATTMTGGAVTLDSSGIISGGSITSATITGSTITGSTLTTGTTGNNISLTTGRLSQRSNLVEVAYSDVATNGGAFGMKDASGNSQAVYEVRNSAAGVSDITFKAVTGTLFIDASASNKDVIFVGSAGNDVYPATDNAMSLGLGSNRWSDLRSVLINGADIGFANGWKLREYPCTPEDIGRPDDWFKENANKGIQLLDDNDKIIAVFTRDGIYGDFKSLNKLENKV